MSSTLDIGGHPCLCVNRQNGIDQCVLPESPAVLRFLWTFILRARRLAKVLDALSAIIPALICTKMDELILCMIVSLL